MRTKINNRRYEEAPAVPLVDDLGIMPAAAYSLRKLRKDYTGAAIRVRRSWDNAEADIGFCCKGELDTLSLINYCAPPTRPLDAVTGAAVAYSTRLIRSAYTGSCMRVRRSIDNTEQDIGFNPSGNLDTVALLAFIGASSGFITTWYDQSTSGFNMAQTTAANQPRIVNAGVVESFNGRPAPYSDGSMWLISSIGDFQSSLSVVATVQATFTQGSVTKMWLGTGQTNSNIKIGVVSATDFYRFMGRTITYPQSYVNGQATVRAHVNTTGAQTTTRDGTAETAGTLAGGTANTAPMSIFSTVTDGQTWTGRISELTFFQSAISDANRLILEQSQAKYFGIAHATLAAGYVTTWYDQSTNAQHAVQTTAANQPRIVNDGMVETLSGRQSIRFDGANVLSNASAIISGDMSYTFNILYASPQSGTRVSFFTGVPNIKQGTGTGYNATSSKYNSFVWTSSESLSDPVVANSPIIQTARREAGVSVVNYINGVSGTVATAPTANFSAGLYIGAAINQYYQLGPISEVIAFPSALSTTDRQKLERNQGKFYRISTL